jgi:hypothetical protein
VVFIYFFLCVIVKMEPEWLSRYYEHARLRASRIAHDIYGEERSFEYMSSEHCVELFSWALPDRAALRRIAGFVHGTRVFDPIAGSGFHAKLLAVFGISVWCGDAQPEADGWVDIHTHDAMAYNWGKDGGTLWLSYAPGNTSDAPEGNTVVHHCVRLRKWQFICLAGNYRDDELRELDGIPFSPCYTTSCIQPWGESVVFRLYSRDD